MKITNKCNLPQPFVDACKNDPYDNGGADFSVTGLIRSPYMARLERDHADELEQDVVELLWALRGQAIHYILERAGEYESAPYQTEQRFFKEMDGLKISGQADAYYPVSGLIQDYKDTSVYAIKPREPKSDWVEQLNLLAELARSNGLKVSKLQIVALAKDWRKSESLRERNYPPRVKVIDVPLWEPVQAKAFMSARVTIHKEGREAASLAEIEPCTMRDTWERQSKVAVMKEGGKRALKLYNHPEQEEDALAHVQRVPGTHLESRPGKWVRCDGFCLASRWCPHYARHMKDVGPE